MRIGQLAREVGVSADTIRFYEKSGWLPRPERRDNNYRDYDDAEVEHLRLLIDLRRMDVPLDVAAQMAGWCHSGHCQDTTTALPQVIAARRRDLAERIAGLRALDDRLADLEAHLAGGRGQLTELQVLAVSGSCCDAAGLVGTDAGGGCGCCAASAGSGAAVDRPPAS
jgi:DNA-binding transcriptional MerR regulator